MYIERDINEKFQKAVPAYNIVALVGPRQAGKTTFLKHSIGQGRPYLMFDDPDVRALFDEDIKRFEARYLEGHETAALDEVQYGKDAGRKLKYLADKGKKLWITSSSQVTLGKEVLSWLVGRASVLQLYPFSLAEFMRAKNLAGAAQAAMGRGALEHIIYGGYPKVVLSESAELKETLLRDLYSLMVLKDVANTFSIEDTSSLERFSRYLSHRIGDVLVYGKISIEMGLSFQTVRKYLDAMEKSYLITRVEPFFTNKLKEVTKQPKLYFVDTGLRNAVANRFPPSLENEGKLFENYVLTELLKKGLVVKYWRTKAGAEVDFVIEKDGVPIPVEVKLSLREKRAGSGLRAFLDAHRPKAAFVVFYDGVPGEAKVGGCRVAFTDVAGLISRL